MAHFVSLFSLVCLLLQSCLSFAQPTSITQVVITSVTGCANVFPITVNCSIPANLSIHTSGVGNLLSSGGGGVNALLLVDYVGGRNNFPLSLDTSDPSNSTLWATVRPGAYNPQWMNTLLNISLYLAGSVNTVIPAFSFAFEPVPVITSISGCTGSGEATTNCAPDSAVITIQGTGIGWLATQSMQLRIGSNVVYLWSSFIAVNATYGTLSLSNIYYGLLFPEHYGGVLLSLHFQSSTSQTGGNPLVIATNAVSISFAPLPPPIFNPPTSTLCDAYSGGLANYTGCSPGYSRLYVRGHYLYNLSATIGSASCVTTYSDAENFQCYPAVGAGLLPYVAYSLTVGNSLGSLSVPSYMSFTAQPSISYIAPCIATILYTTTPSVYSTNYPSCQPGAVLTIRGSQFPLGDRTVQVNILFSPTVSSGLSAFNLSCLTPVVVESSTVTCILPMVTNTSISSVIFGRTLYMRLGFSSSSVWTNSLATVLLRSPQAPDISSLSSRGCDPTTTSTLYPGNPLQATNCASNATLTLTGANFNSSRIVASGVAYTALQQTWTFTATVLSSSLIQVVVQLPDINNPSTTPLVTGIPYQFTLAMYPLTYMQSGVFLVSFASTPPSIISPSSASSTLSSGAMVGVVVAGVVAAAVCTLLAVLMLQRMRTKRLTSGSGSENGSSSLRPRQSHEDSSSDALGGVELQ